MTDFFKQLVGLAGYGLIGIAIVMVIVLAYVIVKKPNNKFALLVLVGFCMFVMVLFTYAGVGVVKENKEISNDNKILKDSTAQLSDKNKELKDSVQITASKLKISSLQYTTLANPNISKDSLTHIVEDISNSLDTLAIKDKSLSKSEVASLATRYKDISEKLNNGEFSTKEAKIRLFETNDKSDVLQKIIDPAAIK